MTAPEAGYPLLYEFLKDAIRRERMLFAETGRADQFDDADVASAIVVALDNGISEIDHQENWGVRVGQATVRWDPQQQPYTEAEAREDSWRNSLPLVHQDVYRITVEFPWEDVPNPKPEPEVPEQVLTRAQTTMIGKVYRVRLPKPDAPTVYIAEVRNDTGTLRWQGSWSGFGVDAVEIIGEVDG